MSSPDPPSNCDAVESSLALVASDEEVVLHLRGFAVLRAGYEAEGYYDEAADGAPAEQDLYRVEVLDGAQGERAAEACEGESIGPLANLGLSEPTLWRLFPSARWTPDDDDPLGLVKRYLLVLAHALRDEAWPAARQGILAGSAGWSPEVITDGFQSLPPRWQEPARRS